MRPGMREDLWHSCDVGAWLDSVEPDSDMNLALGNVDVDFSRNVYAC